LLAWPRVCRPPELGGLGIFDLQRFGYALRMRWLWMKRTDVARPWHLLPDEKEPIIEAMFQASIYVDLGDGRTALFWSDRWLDGKSLAEVAPCLCATVGPRIKKTRTVAQALHGDLWTTDISGALTVQVILDYLLVWDMTRTIQLQPDQPDRVCWKWTPDKIFSTSSAYKSFFIGQQPVEGATLLRKARAPPKCKFFIWLVLHDRCWTAARRKKHGLQDDDSCALCSQAPETIEHLLLCCSFSRELWFQLFHRIGWSAVSPSSHDQWLVAWWTRARKRILKEERSCFDSVVILICWMVWKERNKRIFDRQIRTMHEILDWVFDEICAWFQAGFSKLEPVARALGRLPGRESANNVNT